MITTYILIASIAGIIGFIWVYAIDKMQEDHPDYKGEDFFED